MARASRAFCGVAFRGVGGPSGVRPRPASVPRSRPPSPGGRGGRPGGVGRGAWPAVPRPRPGVPVAVAWAAWPWGRAVRGRPVGVPPLGASRCPGAVSRVRNAPGPVSVRVPRPGGVAASRGRVPWASPRRGASVGGPLRVRGRPAVAVSPRWGRWPSVSPRWGRRWRGRPVRGPRRPGVGRVGAVAAGVRAARRQRRAVGRAGRPAPVGAWRCVRMSVSARRAVARPCAPWWCRSTRAPWGAPY